LSQSPIQIDPFKLAARFEELTEEEKIDVANRLKKMPGKLLIPPFKCDMHGDGQVKIWFVWDETYTPEFPKEVTGT
jgi:hypothetical protein